MGDLRQVSGKRTVSADHGDAHEHAVRGGPYASAAMTTKGNFSQRYGTFEVRVRYPAGQGSGPLSCCSSSGRS